MNGSGSTSDRSIYWSVTINNPRDDDEENIAMARRRGWTVEGQQEVGKEGTPHLQLLVNTRTQQRFTALKKAFPRAHIEMARNPKALKQYVHKEETRVAELTNSEKYVSSQKQLWSLAVDVLESDAIPKEYRILAGEDRAYHDRFDPLTALDYACDVLIRRGFYCIETMAVNPQTRSAWVKFWRAIIARRQQDRQTDRQAELFSQQVDIPVEDGEDTEESQSSDGSSWQDGEGDEVSQIEADEGYFEGSDYNSGEDFDRS